MDKIYREKDGLRFVMQEKEASGSEGEFPSYVPSGEESFTHLYNTIEQFMNQ